MKSRLPGIIKPVLFLPILFFVFSCTFTSTTSKMPEFSNGMDSVVTGIQKIVSIDKYELSGSQSTTDGKTTSVLAITLINTGNPPSDQDMEQYSKIGLQVAQLLKHALKKQNAYDLYKVIFISEQKKGVITQSSSSEYTYRSGEL